MTSLPTGRRILVLDDAERNRGLTSAIFSSADSVDVEVLTACDPEQAREILSGAGADIFVTDVQISGVDFLVDVRAKYPDLPIIVLVGYTDGHLVTETQLGGIATTIIAEPFKQEDVVVAVRNILCDEAIMRAAQTLETHDETAPLSIALAEDDGDIPADIIDKVFDPFFTMDQDKGDTGLGLAICQETIRQGGGEITTQNARNAGAGFVVTVPQTQHSEAPVEAVTLAGGA
jgi:CheY-like chemotaxis protein